MTTTAIIIPCFNKLNYTVNCVGSVAEHTKDLDYRIIAVDNGSSDGTKEYLSGSASWGRNIETIRFEDNRGFGEACNIGIKHALAQGYDYVCLLNNDVEVTAGWLSIMIACLEREKTRGACQPTVCDFGENVRDCGAGLINNPVSFDKVEDFTSVLDCNKTISQLQEMESERLYLNGACLLAKAEVYRNIGVFDPDFFPAYFEEVDWCVRGHIAGYKMIHCGLAVVKHHFNTTSKDMPEMNKFFWDHWNLIKTRYGAYFKLLGKLKQKNIVL